MTLPHRRHAAGAEGQRLLAEGRDAASGPYFERVAYLITQLGRRLGGRPACEGWSTFGALLCVADIMPLACHAQEAGVEIRRHAWQLSY